MRMLPLESMASVPARMLCSPPETVMLKSWLFFLLPISASVRALDAAFQPSSMAVTSVLPQRRRICAAAGQRILSILQLQGHRALLRRNRHDVLCLAEHRCIWESLRCRPLRQQQTGKQQNDQLEAIPLCGVSSSGCINAELIFRSSNTTKAWSAGKAGWTQQCILQQRPHRIRIWQQGLPSCRPWAWLPELQKRRIQTH